MIDWGAIVGHVGGVEETEARSDGAPGWIGECSCGYRTTLYRGDEFETDDPMQSAHDAALAAITRHTDSIA